MNLQGVVGPAAVGSSLAAGTVQNMRLGNQGDAIVSEMHGRYYEAVYRKQKFLGANQAGATTSVGLATTYTGLCLSNPQGSTVNLVLDKVGYSFLVAFAAGAAIGLMTGYAAAGIVTHTTPVTPRNSFLNGPTGAGLLDAACTLVGTPAVATLFASGLTGAITTEQAVSGEIVDMEGSIIIPPGGWAALYTSTASGASGFFGSMSWEEVPV